jgi:hypothetical protein
MNDDKTRSSTHYIDKLNGTNYHPWSVQIRHILKERELFGIVDGSDTTPAFSGTGPPTEAHVAKVSDFDKKVMKACSILVSTITPSLITYIEELDDPAEIWKVLKERYSPRTQSTLLQTVSEFASIRMLEGESMEKHLQKMQALKRRLEKHSKNSPMASSMASSWAWCPTVIR